MLAALGVGLGCLYTPPDMEPARYAALTGLQVAYPPITYPTRPGRDPAWRFESAHPYGDRWRLIRYRHPSGAKDLRWETLDSQGAWIPGLRPGGVADLPLYRDHELRMAIGAGEPLALVESESSADAFAAVGRYATTWAGGASSPPLDRLARELLGAHVLLIPDNDPPGLTCAQRITEAIRPTVASLRTVLPDEGQDARDLLTHHPDRLHPKEDHPR